MKRFALLLALLGLATTASAFIANVGFLMQPSGGEPVGPPPVTYRITTEAGLNITTEAGEPLRTETP